MPRYQFRCPDCGHEIEEFRLSDDRNRAAVCRHCGGKMPRRFVPGRILVPSHFQAHTHLTGLASEMGSRPDIGRRRWNKRGGA